MTLTVSLGAAAKFFWQLEVALGRGASAGADGGRWCDRGPRRSPVGLVQR